MILDLRRTASGKNISTALLIFFVLLKFVLQYLLIDPSYDLQRDEYLHLDQGKHLAWGFISVPPVTSWISKIILLLGNSVFWVKFFPALFGALTIVVTWFIVKELKGGLFAKLLVSVGLTFSVLLRINILYQPNSLDILGWTIFYFTFLKYLNSQNRKWLWMSAISFAFAFLNKYNVVFLLLGLIPALLISEHRTIFLKRQLYISILIAVIILFPNLLWQYQNDFPVYYHLKSLSAGQLVNNNISDFFRSQFVFFYNSCFVLIAGFTAFFIYKPFFRFRVIGLSFVFTLLLFVYFKAKDYYTIGLYPVILAFGAVYFEFVLGSGWKLFLRPFAIIIMAITFIPFLKVAFPLYSPEAIATKSKKYKSLGLLRWEDGKDHALPQDFADMLGWKELAGKVDLIYDTVSDKSHTLVYCDNYGQAGAVNYYSRNHLNAVSMNADYINWFPFEKGEIQNIIFIRTAHNSDPNMEKEKPLFDSVIKCGQIENKFAREQGTSVYLLKGARQFINRILHDEIRQRKITHED